jgi:hypothetical protein
VETLLEELRYTDGGLAAKLDRPLRLMLDSLELDDSRPDRK